MKTILFPCYPYDLKNVEPDFEVEYNAAKLAGFDIVLFSHDELTDDNKVKLNKEPKTDMLLRSWMLHGYQYHHLYDIIKKKYNVSIVNNPTQYSNCHYFPRLFKIINEDTPRMNIFIPNNLLKTGTFKEYFNNLNNATWKNMYAIFKELNSDCILKDFVKSEKGTDLFMLKKEISINNFIDHIKRFVDVRGNLFNVGLTFKKVVNLKKYVEVKDSWATNEIATTNEWRGFYLNGKLAHLSLNVNCDKKLTPPDECLLTKYNNSIDSNFYTLDFAELEDNSWIIIEGGDGQVSGLTPNSDAIEFYNNFCLKNKKVVPGSHKKVCIIDIQDSYLLNKFTENKIIRILFWLTRLRMIKIEGKTAPLLFLEFDPSELKKQNDTLAKVLCHYIYSPDTEDNCESEDKCSEAVKRFISNFSIGKVAVQNESSSSALHPIIEAQHKKT